MALHTASQYWGGAGFILVPHRNGVVDDRLLGLVKVYDPDHVVLLRPSLAMWEAVRPGHIQIPGPDGIMTGEELNAFLAHAGGHLARDPDGLKARDRVATACSPHRRRLDDGGPWTEDLTHVTPGTAARQLTQVATLRPGLTTEPHLTTPAAWGGLLGVAIASTCGMTAPPTSLHEPELDDDVLLETLRWTINPDVGWGSPPQQLVWHPPQLLEPSASAVESAFAKGTLGLTWILDKPVWPLRLSIVVGNTAVDFALAFGIQRVWGNAVWLPTQWLTSENQTVAATVVSAVHDRIQIPHYEQWDLTVISSSLAPAALATLAAKLQELPVLVVNSDTGQPLDPADHQPELRVTEFDPNYVGRLHLGVKDQYSQSHALPVRRGPTGGLEMLTPAPPPVIETSELRNVEGLMWQVDVDLIPRGMPRGRGLDGAHLLAAVEDQYLTWVRSGRGGICYLSHRQNLVLSGTPPLSRLACPRLREPSLYEWCQLIAAAKGVSISLAEAGRRATTIARLLGGREGLIDVFAGQLLGALQAFQPHGRSSSESYPDRDGVQLGDDGYMTFVGIRNRMIDGGEVEEARDQIDRLLADHLLRRGVVINCVECGRPSFVSVDSLRQENECPQCAAFNQLAQPRWRQPADEPTWLYDLHPAARKLLVENGHGPLLLAAHLRVGSRDYVDIPEVLAVREDSHETIAETDLLALRDGQLYVAEAKTTDRLAPTRRELASAAKKRVEIAHIFGANILVLATTEPQWVQSSIDAMRSAINEYEWDGQTPSLRVVTGLGSFEPQEITIDL
jgi:hypothetical protein